jgi:hypothetical protein
VAKYPFLSDEWIAAAKQVYDEHKDSAQPVTHAVKVNMVVSDAPFGNGTVEAHLDTSSGELVMGKGHIDGADVKLAVDWATAKAVFVEQNAQAGMQAFMAGKIRLMEGDLMKLMSLQTSAANPDPVAKEVAQQLQALTE